MAPALVLEYKINEKDVLEWEYDDLYKVCSYFGEIFFLEIEKKTAILVYKNFFDAFTCKEYLLNTNNFKSIDKNNNIAISWFSNEDYFRFNPKIVDQIKKIAIDNYNREMLPNSTTNNISLAPDDNYCSNMNNNLNSYYAAWTLSPNTNFEFNNILSNQNNNQQYPNNINNYSNQNYNNVNINNYINHHNYYYPNSFYFCQNNQANEIAYKVIPFLIKENFEFEDKKFKDKHTTGKYTCRYDIEIENDKEFQVSRRLIGPKVKFNLLRGAI